LLKTMALRGRTTNLNDLIRRGLRKEEDEPEEPQPQPQHSFYDGIEVVGPSDEKMVVEDEDRIIPEHSTLEVLDYPSNKQFDYDYTGHPYDFYGSDNYSTLEVRPPSVHSLPICFSPSLAQRSPSLLDAPLPPLPHERAPNRAPTSKFSSRSLKQNVLKPRRMRECGVWFDRRFYAGEEGMEIKMSRNSTIFRDMRWEVMCGSTRVLGARGNPNSWKEKRGRFLCFFPSFNIWWHKRGYFIKGNFVAVCTHSLFKTRRVVLVKVHLHTQLLILHSESLKGCDGQRRVLFRIASILPPNLGFQKKLEIFRTGRAMKSFV
jgi:hypothetical protein